MSDTHVHITGCFLLTAYGRDTAQGYTITLIGARHEAPTLCVTVPRVRPVFFVPRDTPQRYTQGCSERAHGSLHSLATPSQQVDCCYFDSYAALIHCRDRLRRAGHTPYESDVDPVARFCMERFIRGGFQAGGTITRQDGDTVHLRAHRVWGADVTPSLSVLYCAAVFDTTARPRGIACCCGDERYAFVMGDTAADRTPRPPVYPCTSEHHLLSRFFRCVAHFDPDIICCWQDSTATMARLHHRCRAQGVEHTPGRSVPAAATPHHRDEHNGFAIPGRLLIDGARLVATYYGRFSHYDLAHVARRVLPDTTDSTPHGHSNTPRHRGEDPASPPACLQAACTLQRTVEHTDVLATAIEKSKCAGNRLDQMGQTIAAFDYLYLPQLHRAGYVARDKDDVPASSSALPGGYVMDTTPGFYDNVLVLDFKSLYPTCMITFHIDPLGHVTNEPPVIETPAHTRFSAATAILPALLRELLARRTEAKKAGNTPLSTAIKLLMNSFYGVLGTRYCRFFNPHIAATITRTGRYVLSTCATHIAETHDVEVIYGDTDSLFLCLGPDTPQQAFRIGTSIARETTHWLAGHLKERFHVESALELEFESHFTRFFMPGLRGSRTGSKKRYCGLVNDGKGERLVFKGLESARSDWTAAAARFQKELFRRVFAGREVDEFIRTTVTRIRAGHADALLAYRKRINKPLHAYGPNPPHHIQAAAKLATPPRESIAYYLTTDGPQPVEKRSAPLDYDHYIDAQIKPVADAVLPYIDKSFDAIVSGQTDLFAGDAPSR
jgi:DNA polymerase-2